MNQRASISWTMTWAVAFTIVLFLMVVFFVATTFLSERESFNKNQINFQEAGNFDSQIELMKILNSQVIIDFEKINVRKLIGLWFESKEDYEEDLENEIKKVLNGIKYESFNSKGEIVEVNFGIVIQSFKDEEKFPEIDIASDEFYSNACFGTPQCTDLSGVYILVGERDFVYVTIQGSQEVKDE